MQELIIEFVVTEIIVKYKHKNKCCINKSSPTLLTLFRFMIHLL